VSYGPIYSIDQMFEDDQVKHLGIAQGVPNAENRRMSMSSGRRSSTFSQSGRISGGRSIGR
jgi:hypothetical protein